MANSATVHPIYVDTSGEIIASGTQIRMKHFVYLKGTAADQCIVQDAKRKTVLWSATCSANNVTIVDDLGEAIGSNGLYVTIPNNGILLIY